MNWRHDADDNALEEVRDVIQISALATVRKDSKERARNRAENEGPFEAFLDGSYRNYRS